MSAEPDAKALGERIAALYSEIAAGPMAGLPICNPALAVAAVGFRLHAGRAVGIVATPWFMNIVAADLPGFPPTPPARPGETRVLALPAGTVDLIVGELPGFGRLDAASLFSPMFEFADMAAAVETAEAAARELFEPPPAPPLPPRAGVDRRAFLRGRMAEPEIAE